jgi:hypothetical protein
MIKFVYHLMPSWKKVCLPQRIDFSSELHYEKEDNHQKSGKLSTSRC